MQLPLTQTSTPVVAGKRLYVRGRSSYAGHEASYDAEIDGLVMSKGPLANTVRRGTVISVISAREHTSSKFLPIEF